MTTLPDNTRNQLAKLQDELEGCRQVIADFTHFEGSKITELKKQLDGKQREINELYKIIHDLHEKKEDERDIPCKNSNTNIEMERAIEQKDLAIAQLKTNVNRLTSEHSLLKYFNTKQAESILTLRLERDNNQKAVIIQLNNDNDKIVELTEKLRQADSVIHSLTQKLFTNPLHRSHAWKIYRSTHTEHKVW